MSFAAIRRRCMSVHAACAPTAPSGRKKVTIQTLISLKRSQTPITMLTAYDYPTALSIASVPSIDITLVGDSLAQTCLGYSSTTQLTLNEMIHHASAVHRGTAHSHPFLVADMPFGTYHTTPADAAANAVRLVREGGVEGVKIEGGQEVAEVVYKLVSVGIPVMGHVGLLPQRHVEMSGYRVQGKDVDGAERVLKDALAIQEAGAFAMVVEAVPTELGKYISEKLRVPTIGIGAGPWTDGQVLVWDDIMSTTPSTHKPKFVRRFADAQSIRRSGIQDYAEAVRNRSFPDPQRESYAADAEQWEMFLNRVG